MSRRSAVYQQLAQRIRGEVVDLDRVSRRVLSSWSRARQSELEQDLIVDAVALNLHGFYSGLERLFELIARQVDRALPGGETWRRDLLALMARPVGEVRPAVINEKNLQALDELGRFRHLVRNVYTFNLVPDKIDPLMTLMTATWPQLRAEMLAFADFLTDLADATSNR